MGNVDAGSGRCGRMTPGHRVAGEGSPATTPEAPGPAGGVTLPTPGGADPYVFGGMVPGPAPLGDLPVTGWWS